MKKKKSIFIITLIIIILTFIIFRNIKLGYNKISFIYDMKKDSQIIELGVPKFSFMGKESDKSYSYKNIRNNKIFRN